MPRLPPRAVVPSTLHPLPSTLYPLPYPVSRSPHRNDVPRRTRIVAESLSERREVRLHGATLAPLGVAPHFAQQLVARHHTTAVPQQRREQVELFRAKRDFLIAATNN